MGKRFVIFVLIISLFATLVLTACGGDTDYSLEEAKQTELASLSKQKERIMSACSSELDMYARIYDQSVANINAATSREELERESRLAYQRGNAFKNVFLHSSIVDLNKYTVTSTVENESYTIVAQSSTRLYVKSADSGITFKSITLGVYERHFYTGQVLGERTELTDMLVGDSFYGYVYGEENYIGVVAQKDGQTLGCFVFGETQLIYAMAFHPNFDRTLTEEQQKSLIEGCFRGENVAAEFGFKPIPCEIRGEINGVEYLVNTAKIEEDTLVFDASGFDGVVLDVRSDLPLRMGDSVTTNALLSVSDGIFYPPNEDGDCNLKVVIYRGGRLMGFAIMKMGYESTPFDSVNYSARYFNARVVAFVVFDLDSSRPSIADVELIMNEYVLNE